MRCIEFLTSFIRTLREVQKRSFFEDISSTNKIVLKTFLNDTTPNVTEVFGKANTAKRMSKWNEKEIENAFLKKKSR